MGQDKLNNLLARYLKGTINKVELHQLLDLLDVNDPEALDLTVDKLVETGVQPDSGVGQFDQDAVLRRIRRRTNKRLVGRYWLAAGVAGFLIFMSVMLHQHNSRFPSANTAIASSDILLPEQGQAAIVRLSDGTVYELARTDKKTLRTIGVIVAETADGETLVTLTRPETKTAGINTITNGKGSTCNLQFADGSRVWLNASASLSYPSEFEASRRHVSLEGEAFFDVAPDARRPFEVSTTHTTVSVLGTQFNLANDQSTGVTQTTLVEGSVEVSNGKHSLILNPGWQATTEAAIKEIPAKTVNIRDVLAWKDGYFRFNDHTIAEVMAQVAAWYNIDQVYIRKQSGDRFTGSVSRTQKLSDVLLQLAEISSYRFDIKERSVYIMK